MTKAGQEEPAEVNGHDHRVARALGAGLAGALSLTAMHQAGRQLRSDAPRMDLVGQRALIQVCKALGLKPPRGKALFFATLAGDVLSNTGFYAALLAGRPVRPWLRESVGGALAGVGALALPPALGLGKPPRARGSANRLMTVAWYTLGGLAAAAVFRAVSRRATF